MKSTFQLLAILAALLVSAQSLATDPTPLPRDGMDASRKLHFIIGARYIKTTIQDCEIRTGDYVSYPTP